MKKIFILGLYLAGLAVFAQQTQQADTDEKIKILAEEVDKLKTGKSLFNPIKDEKGKFGMGPAASKVYNASAGVSLAGYGEFVYENYDAKLQNGTASSNLDQIDALRAVLYLGYKFNDWIVFNSELEWEHTNSSALEFAYLDFMFHDLLNIRAGLLLVPMGMINMLHEPTVYLGTKKPLTETYILPTTWRENGVGLFGSIAGFSYHVYGLNGFNSTGFSADKGLREGRQQGSKSKAEDFAGVARLDYENIPGLIIGGSGYYGDSGQKQVGAQANTKIADAHADFRFRGLQLRGVYTYGWVADVDRINAAKSVTGDKSVGSEMRGWYVEIGYDIFRLFKIDQKLVMFTRFEKINTQVSSPDSYTSNPANDRQIVTTGFHYQPIINIAIKTDYMFVRNNAETGNDQWNVSLGYVF